MRYSYNVWRLKCGLIQKVIKKKKKNKKYLFSNQNLKIYFFFGVIYIYTYVCIFFYWDTAAGLGIIFCRNTFILVFLLINTIQQNIYNLARIWNVYRKKQKHLHHNTILTSKDNGREKERKRKTDIKNIWRLDAA